ncbi:hypothetical protein CLOM_g13853 [Closterium sp. NIES-68]|nr:hypothetical protein CLOM_g13853 [Closterium sp. NIES-68]GJP67418.1 hypothetical protein CLOP_g24237 [Closterium sp. NIES-67]
MQQLRSRAAALTERHAFHPRLSPLLSRTFHAASYHASVHVFPCMAEEREGQGGGSAVAGSAPTPAGSAAAVAGGGAAASAAGTATAEAVRQNLNRLRYRSRQRGYLELDLLLGKWVDEHLPSLDDPQLRALARLMDEESPDLFKWFTGQEQAPQHVVENPVYHSIRAKVDTKLHLINPAVKATPGMPWVRWWEDVQRQPGTPRAGNQ